MTFSKCNVLCHELIYSQPIAIFKNAMQVYLILVQMNQKECVLYLTYNKNIWKLWSYLLTTLQYIKGAT